MDEYNGQNEELARRCLRRQAKLERKRAPLEPLWQEAARRILPLRADITGERPPEERGRTDHLFDSTAMLALGKFGAALESIATPRNTKWHNIVPADPALADNVEVMRYCEAVRDALFSLRARPGANFVSAAQDVYRSIGVFGHGAMLIDHKVGVGMRYISIPAKELWFDVDAAGVLDTAHRKYTLTPREALREFAHDELPEDIRRLAGTRDEKDLDLEFLHCVFPNPDCDPERDDAAAMRYASVHIYGRGKRIVRKSGYRTMPYVVPRYETMPGTAYGFGPGLLALPEVKMVNEMGKTLIRAAHLTVAPPLLVRDDDLLESFSVGPDALNFGGLDESGAPAVRALETNRRLDIGLDFLRSRQLVINDAFLVTLFQILVEQPQMTATEVLQRANEKGVLLAPTMGRLQEEMLGPCIAREIDALSRVPGVLPDPPEEIVLSGGLVDVEYASPLAKSMQAGGALGIVRLLEVLMPLAQVDPGVLDIINPEEAARVIAKAYDAPARALRSPEEIAAVKMHRAGAQQAQAALAAAPVIAQSAENLARAQALAGTGEPL